MEFLNPAEDLTINWEGGNEGKVGIRLMPALRPRRGHDGGPGGMHGGPGHDPKPPMDRVIFVILETNTGTYTFTTD